MAIRLESDCIAERYERYAKEVEMMENHNANKKLVEKVNTVFTGMGIAIAVSGVLYTPLLKTGVEMIGIGFAVEISNQLYDFFLKASLMYEKVDHKSFT